MEIIELEGEDQRLYRLVAHLVMNKNVLSYNQNYPFKTSPEYRWFVAVDNEVTLGFIPVKMGKGKVTINNYYIPDDQETVFSALLKKLIKKFHPDFEIESITQIRHIPVFEKNGFLIVLNWSKYVKMKVQINEKKCL
ncbi:MULTISPECIES: hypothetical protein [unclassified Parabacteroides]|uniref:hypothetical protein n=1 Tax=unclassified Parabacteroides TaxID=2649774 RepID=UPI002474A9DC|nr:MULTISPECIES: hypothetical protein [unclassified Parabacteroides]